MENKPLRSRRHGRRRVQVDATLRNGSGVARGAELTDLSEAGCRMELGEGAVEPDEVLVVRPGGLGGLTGRVRWTRGNAAGVEFADPLHPAVVDHVSGERELEGQAPRPPRPANSGFTDNFGRPLPSLGNPRRR
ncbi:MAG: PilZ domain-containing protein [Novosphingobium sp.]|nr:PilZ domain-containing protein [Novosphingobium sp.]